MAESERTNGVGPVLEASAAGRAVLKAICALNENVAVEDRGAYLRVSVPGRCRVTREAIEQSIGREFDLRLDLEPLMPAFKGQLRLDDDAVEWSDGKR